MNSRLKDSIPNPYIIRLFVFITLIITFFAYFPGLSGDFIFDDASNLRHIAVYNQYNGFDALIKYVLSNESGVLKRPISTLSFLLNSTTWPANAYYFKLTNIIIHLINGLLLYLVTCKLLIQLNFKANQIKYIALIHMSIWLLHPYFVSTTLYVVQRMSMFPALFVLIGIYLYLKARETVIKNQVWGIIYLILAVGLCTLLATLSKENGIILPILLLVIENILNKSNSKNKLNKNLKLIFLILPSLIITIAFIYKIPDFIENYNLREFSIVERLLTQPRVVMTYLFHLFAPNYLTESVYTDGFIVSTSLIQPLSTLLSILFVLTLIIFAIMKRKSSPLISLSILFFFTALIIESTVVPLEIYFEHRSYLPSLFIFLPLSVFLFNGIKYSKIYMIIISAIIFYLSLSTYLRSDLWGNNIKLITVTSLKFPESVRATNRRASILFSQGHTSIAIKLLDNAAQSHPNLTIKLNIIKLKCSIKQSIDRDFNDLLQSLKYQSVTKDDRNSLIAIFNLLSTSDCTKDSIMSYHKLVQAIKHNKGYNNPAIKSTLDFHEAYVLLKMGNYKQALKLFEGYLIEHSNFGDIIYASEEFMKLNQNQQALKLLESLQIQLTQNNHNKSKIKLLDKTQSLLEKIKQLNL